MSLLSAIALVVAWIATYVVLCLRAWPRRWATAVHLDGERLRCSDACFIGEVRSAGTPADGLTLNLPGGERLHLTHDDRWHHLSIATRVRARVWPARAIVASAVAIAVSYLIG